MFYPFSMLLVVFPVSVIVKLVVTMKAALTLKITIHEEAIIMASIIPNLSAFAVRYGINNLTLVHIAIRVMK